MSGQRTLSFIFFISGAASLVFEIVWLYRCGLVFGNSVWAASVVLSSFMGGLALGNGLAGSFSPRIRSPLRVYAVAEFTVAGAGVALAYILALPTTAILPLSRFMIDNVWLLNTLRFVTTFTALLLPATAMGATLPLLVSAQCRWREATGGESLAPHRRGLAGRDYPGDFGATLGRLYGWNTLGAVCGAICAEGILVQRLGVTGTAWIAGLLDGVVAAVALWLARREPPTTTQHGRPDVGSQGSRAITRSTKIRLEGAQAVLIAAFVSGGTLLALEVVWFRFLSTYVLTTTLAMSVMLAVVLAAIGLGGLATSSWLARSARAVRSLPPISLMAGCAVVVSYASFQSLTQGTQVGDWYRVLWFACVLTCPASWLSGAIFTLLGETLAQTHRSFEVGPDVERRAAARLTMANTTGAMCGPLVATFVLLPALGMERSIFVLALAYAGVAFLSILALQANAIKGRRPVVIVAALVFLVLMVEFPFGLMQGTYFARAAAAYELDGSRIVATREGPNETIFLMEQSWLGQPVYHRLVTNGFSMSGTAVPAMRYMRDFVYLPMLLHRSPLRRVLVVCYGVGVTAGAATDIASTESIDIVEISRDVVAMSDLIHPPARHPLHDARTRLHIEDGRFFLATTTDRFDLITGEPPPPRTPGAVNIYTREYFHLIYDRLSDGGMTSYWLPVGRPDPGTDVNTIVRAFCDVFDDCSAWNATPFDVILIGSRHASGPASEADFAKAWTMPVLATHLREVGFEGPEQIGATFIGDAAYLRELTSDAPPLTDDYPQRLRPTRARVSLSDPRIRDDPAVAALYRRVIDPDRARHAFATSAFIRTMLPPALIRKTLPLFDEQRMINRVLWEGGQPLRLIDDLDAVLTRTSLRTLPLWILGSDDVKQRIAASVDPGTGATEYTRGLDALVAREYLDAALAFSDADRRGFRGITVRPLLAYALLRAGRVDEARQRARDADRRSDDEVRFWHWLLGQLGDP